MTFCDSVAPGTGSTAVGDLRQYDRLQIWMAQLTAARQPPNAGRRGQHVTANTQSRGVGPSAGSSFAVSLERAANA